MDSNTRNSLCAEAIKYKKPFRFADIFFTGVLPERLNFFCDMLPFTYHQGSISECLKVIWTNKTKANEPTGPMIVCSTGRHIAQESFSDYHEVWTALKYSYADRLQAASQ